MTANQFACRWLALLLALPAVIAGCSNPAELKDTPTSAQDALVRSVPESPPAANAPVDSSAVARVELQTTKYDMGVIENDGIAMQKMKVSNRGDAPLKISHVSTSCGCTTGEMESNVIAPGADANLIIRVDPAKIPGFFAEKVLTLHTNDPTNPQPSVSVVSNVKPEAVFSPDVLDFGTIALGEGAVLTSTVRQMQDAPLELDGAALGRDVPFIEIEIAPIPEANWTVPGKREFTLTARVTKEARVGVYDEWIWVNTNIKRYRNIPIKFKGEILGPYTVSPREVAVRAVVPGVTIEGVLTIQSEKPLKVVSISNSNSAIQVKERPGGIPNSFVFDLTVPSRTPSRALRDTWTITLDADGAEHVETITVTAILARDD